MEVCREGMGEGERQRQRGRRERLGHHRPRYCPGIRQPVMSCWRGSEPGIRVDFLFLHFHFFNSHNTVVL